MVAAGSTPVFTREKLQAWLQNESGATAIEYSLISGAMALVLVPALTKLTTETGGLYTTIINAFDSIH